MTLNKSRKLINKKIIRKVSFSRYWWKWNRRNWWKRFYYRRYLNNVKIKLKQDIIDSPSQAPISTNQIIKDFSKYEVIKKENYLTLYKY